MLADPRQHVADEESRGSGIAEGVEIGGIGGEDPHPATPEVPHHDLLDDGVGRQRVEACHENRIDGPGSDHAEQAQVAGPTELVTGLAGVGADRHEMHALDGGMAAQRLLLGEGRTTLIGVEAFSDVADDTHRMLLRLGKPH